MTDASHPGVSVGRWKMSAVADIPSANMGKSHNEAVSSDDTGDVASMNSPSATITQMRADEEDKITSAAMWLADQPRNPVPVISILRDRFRLTHDEAHEAVVLAGKMQVLRRAFG